MKTKTIIILAALGLCVFFGLGVVISAFGFRSDCYRTEAGIKMQYQANQSSYDAYWKTIKEMAQVPEMYVGDLEKVYKSAISARYGADGTKAMFQFIKEHNPNFDSNLYTKIQTAIEAGRARFNADQAQLLDKKREYLALLGTTRALLFGGIFRFPTFDVEKEYGIVTSGETEQAFTTGKAEPLKLR